MTHQQVIKQCALIVERAFKRNPNDAGKMVMDILDNFRRLRNER